MSNPWDIKTDDSRESDLRPVFIIFCEDEVSEPIYFESFRTSKIEVNAIRNQRSKIDNVVKAIDYCKQNSLMEVNDEELHFNKEDIQIWCVFDRDIEDSDLEIRKQNILFDESVTIANTKGFNVAWSNDAFELWILLHFEDVDVTDEKYKNRKAYYDRLTEILKALPNPNSELVKALKHDSFYYKKDFKSANNFKQIIIPEIVGKTSTAIENAKRIEAHFADKNILNHKKAPCTLVHHLVEELIRLGGKEI